jgi:hypothetical protein
LTLEGLKEDVPAWVKTMNWRTVEEDFFSYKPQRMPLCPFESFYLAPTQELGKVKILEGRMVAFPSLMQHRSTNFTTADKRLPASCKILSLFLVDLHVRVISSANIPPQRKAWRREREWMIYFILRQHLPQELVSMILRELNNIEHAPISDQLEPMLNYRLMRQRNRMRIQDLQQSEAPFPGLGGVSLLDEPWWCNAFDW